jgi:hypothetical protein
MKYFTTCLLLLVIIVVLYVIVNLVNTLHFTSNNEGLNSYANKTFYSSCKYADVEFTTSEDGDTIFINVNYKDLTGVSAIHIHTNNHGSPGPILAWLGTSNEWQHGVAQNTPGSNMPCCSANNKLCTLAAPNSTPYISNLSNTVHTFTVTNAKCKDCPWLENGTFLDVHGFNFQQVVNGKLTNEKPGADIISNTLFSIK